jgi:hypothetical protein
MAGVFVKEVTASLTTRGSGERSAVRPIVREGVNAGVVPSPRRGDFRVYAAITPNADEVGLSEGIRTYLRG